MDEGRGAEPIAERGQNGATVAPVVHSPEAGRRARGVKPSAPKRPGERSERLWAHGDNPM